MNRGFDFLLYNLPNESVSVKAIVKDETIWLTQKAMAELFDVGIPAINKHLSNIYEEGELSKSSTISNLEIVQTEENRSVKRTPDFYNLDVLRSEELFVAVTLHVVKTVRPIDFAADSRSFRDRKSNV